MLDAEAEGGGVGEAHAGRAGQHHVHVAAAPQLAKQPHELPGLADEQDGRGASRAGRAGGLLVAVLLLLEGMAGNSRRGGERGGGTGSGTFIGGMAGTGIMSIVAGVIGTVPEEVMVQEAKRRDGHCQPELRQSVERFLLVPPRVGFVPYTHM